MFCGSCEDLQDESSAMDLAAAVGTNTSIKKSNSKKGITCLFIIKSLEKSKHYFNVALIITAQNYIHIILAPTT